MHNRKLGRTSSQRRAMLRGMVTYLFENGQIETTYTRAKEVTAVAEKMITVAKKGGLAAYREALSYITKEEVAKKLFDVIAPAYDKRNGGYTQIYKLGPRRGDAAEMALVRLVAEKKEEVAPAAAPKKTRKPAAKKAEKVEAPVEEAPAVEEAPVEEAAPIEEPKAE